MNQIIAHVDMDSFFAAVEEKDKPELKGKPVVIGGHPSQKRGVVSTANYEARKFGIKSAMPISKAYQLNPNAIFIQSNFKRYKEESRAVMNILKTFASEFEQVSIDEAYLNITDFANKQNSLEEAAKIIKKEILKQTKLTCSIGISNSRRVSKIASDFHKPAGTTVVNNPKQFLKDLPVNKIPGIGRVAYKRMQKLNINLIGDLAKADKFLLLDNFGKYIITFQELAKGNDKSGVNNNDNYIYKSISCERTFQDDITLEDCEKKIEKISNQVFMDLRKCGYKTVSIKVRYNDFHTITKDKSLKVTHSDIEQIKKTSKELLKSVPNDKKIRLFGIKLSNICIETLNQTNLESFI